MATTSSLPQLQRGAIIGLDPGNPAASVVIFQYNPHQLTRSLSAKTAGENDREEALRLNGAPVETITLEVEIDAIDQMGDKEQDKATQELGVYPQLSALEMLLYPKSAQVIANTLLLAAGTREIIPPSAPLALFVWGVKRVVPVRITSFSITEESHDINLNPIRATVNLTLQVLSYNDLLPTNIGYHLFLAYQGIKESMATLNSVNGLNTAFMDMFSKFS